MGIKVKRKKVKYTKEEKKITKKDAVIYSIWGAGIEKEKGNRENREKKIKDNLGYLWEREKKGSLQRRE